MSIIEINEVQFINKGGNCKFFRLHQEHGFKLYENSRIERIDRMDRMKGLKGLKGLQPLLSGRHGIIFSSIIHHQHPVVPVTGRRRGKLLGDLIFKISNGLTLAVFGIVPMAG